MDMSMNENPWAVLPELTLVLAAVAGLLVGSFTRRDRQYLVRAIAVLGCVAGIGFAVADLSRPTQQVFDTTYTVDTTLGAVRITVLVAVLLTIGLSVDRFSGHPRESELYVLLLLGGLGAIVLGGASDLVLLVAAYLLASIPLYALVGLARNGPGGEAAMKYYLMGALSGVTMLVGVTLLSGVGGSSQYRVLTDGLATAPRAVVAVGLVALLAGLLFKIGAVPLHFWVPDVVHGAPVPVAAFVATVPKIGGLVALYRIAGQIPPADVSGALLIAIVSAATMTLGNFAAFFQDDVRRLLGYSAISQVGYLLLAVAGVGAPLAPPALLFYLLAYAVTNLGAFAVVAALPRATALDDYRSAARRHPWLVLSLVVCLVGLIGTPPTAVFVGKLAVFTTALDADLAWLAALAVLNTVASVFYYLRWIVPAFRSVEPGTESDVLASPGARSAATAVLAAVLSVALGLAAGPVLALLASRSS